MKKNNVLASFLTSISFGTLIIGGSKLLNLTLKILVSQLGVSNFGDYYLVTATFLGLTTIAALGVPMSTTRFISFLNGGGGAGKLNKIVSSAVTIICLSSFLVGIFLYQFSEATALWLGAVHTAVYLKILSFGFIGSTITLLTRSVFLGFVRIHAAYTVEATEIVTRFVSTIAGILLLKMGVIGALIGFTTGTLIAALINMHRLLKIPGVNQLTPQLSGKFLRFTLPVSTSEILTAVTGVFFLYILRLRGGAEAIGLYAAAVSLAALIYIVPQMIFSVFLPLASNLYAQKKPVFPIYKTLFLWLVGIVGAPSVFLIVFSRVIISSVFGQAYIHAAPILSTLVIAYSLYAVFAWPSRQLLDIAGHTKANLLLTLLRILVGSCVLFIYNLELNGLTLATAVLWGWIAESIGSMVLVYKKRLL